MWKVIVFLVFFLIFDFNSNGAEAKTSPSPAPKNKTVANYPSLPSIISQKFKSLQNETEKKCDKNCDKNSRKPKSLAGLSFLTGLGLGSLAGAAALSDPLSTQLIPNHQNIYANLYSKLPTATISPLSESSLPGVKWGKNHFELDNSRVNNANYPYALALSTNSLVNDTLRSVQQVLEQLKDRLDQRESLNAEQSNSRPQYDDIDDDDNAVVGFNQRLILNCSTLQEIIRNAIAEEIARSQFNFFERQATRMNNTNTSLNDSGELANDSAPKVTTEMSTTTSTTTVAPTAHGTYYGGHPQNVAGVDLTSYGPPIHPVYPVYPPLTEIYPAPPSYGPVNFHQEYPTYESYHGSSFTGLQGPYHDGIHYARGQTIAARTSKDLKSDATLNPAKIQKNR